MTQRDILTRVLAGILMILATGVIITYAQKPEPPWLQGEPVIKGSDQRRDSHPNPKAPVPPDLLATETTEFMAGPVTVNQTVTKIDKLRSNMVLRLSDATGDTVEVDVRRLSDKTLDTDGWTYAAKTRAQLEKSASAQEYMRRLHKLETEIDTVKEGAAKRPITAEETQLLLHAMILGIATGHESAAIRQFAERWTLKQGLRPAQRGGDCYPRFMENTDHMWRSAYDCVNAVPHQRWYNQAWYSGSCAVEFSMRTISLWGEYLGCSNVHIPIPMPRKG